MKYSRVEPLEYLTIFETDQRKKEISIQLDLLADLVKDFKNHYNADKITIYVTESVNERDCSSMVLLKGTNPTLDLYGTIHDGQQLAECYIYGWDVEAVVSSLIEMKNRGFESFN